MKEYYYILDNKQLGPFAISELMNEALSDETLIWTAGMENWKMLKDIPELMNESKPKIGPPPIPTLHESVETFKNSDHINVIIKNEQKQSFQIFRGDKKKLNWFIGWCILHSFAMLMSYSQVSIFNSFGKPCTNQFWPFFSFFKQTGYEFISSGISNYGHVEYIYKFGGVFAEYDLTEFIFYVSAAFIILQIMKTTKKIEGIN